MDIWQMERMMEAHRNELLREAADWRLEQEALRAVPARTGWFARNMLTLGNWMVSVGERIRKRYENIPAPRPTMSNVNG